MENNLAKEKARLAAMMAHFHMAREKLAEPPLPEPPVGPAPRPCRPSSRLNWRQRVVIWCLRYLRRGKADSVRVLLQVGHKLPPDVRASSCPGAACVKIGIIRTWYNADGKNEPNC